MHGQWTYGPVSQAELKERATYGHIDPDDPVWREGDDLPTARRAGAVLDFPASQPRGGWLSEAPPAPRAKSVNWLDDVHQTDRGEGPGKD
jgi:hypothetical protein